jgi:hypothetical protein
VKLIAIIKRYVREHRRTKADRRHMAILAEWDKREDAREAAILAEWRASQ